MTRISSMASVAFTLLGFAHAAQAHQIWIEQPAGQKTGILRFSVSYVTTLTYVKPDGVAPIPAGPAAAPNR
jgi:hypothetical protein